jgi:hypothetical protein
VGATQPQSARKKSRRGKRRRLRQVTQSFSPAGSADRSEGRSDDQR